MTYKYRKYVEAELELDKHDVFSILLQYFYKRGLLNLHLKEEYIRKLYKTKKEEALKEIQNLPMLDSYEKKNLTSLIELLQNFAQLDKNTEIHQ